VMSYENDQTGEHFPGSTLRSVRHQKTLDDTY
jgi:hypothetical protein